MKRKKNFEYAILNDFSTKQLKYIVSKSPVPLRKLPSKKEDLVNLGSAYGIRPGHRMTVWREQPLIRDPNTGMEIIPRERKGIVKVTQVNSGLSCVAKGSGGLIAQIRVGDKVFTR